MRMKLSRNDPCPCGSGKKYKKCCLIAISTDNQALKERVKQRLGEKAIVVENPAGLPKMSEIILEYAEELLDYASLRDRKEKAIMLACFAWNLALVDETERKQQIDKLFTAMNMQNEQDKQALLAILTALIAKKKIDYAWCNRLILDYQVIETDKEFKLNIVSSSPT